jgi:creatinine amidohydrolase/Fe(II)-dependent formamide hydrolase-like protein
MRFWGGGTVRILNDWLVAEGQKRPEILGHGTMWETSLVMAVHPNWVDLPRAQRIEDYCRPSQLKKQTKKRTEAIAQANADLGRQQIGLAAERAAKIARELLQEMVEEKKGRP